MVPYRSDASGGGPPFDVYREAPIPILVHEGGTIIDINIAMEQLLHLTRKQIIGRHVLDFVAPEDHAQVQERLRTREDSTSRVTAVRQDGTTFPAEVQVAEKRVEGRPIRIAVIRDVTEQERLEEDARQSIVEQAELDRLRQMNDFKTQLLNTAAHELNTPLTPLRLQLHLLRTGTLGDLNDRQRKAVRVLDRNVERLGRLVKDILDVARMQNGRMRLEKEEVSIPKLIREAMEAFEETAARLGIRLRATHVDDAVVEGDHHRLTQVLFNLISNALKFTPEGGHVDVSCHIKDDVVHIEVQDDGLGIEESAQERLFQPFSQVHDPMQVTARGTGLGLYICKGIVEQHDGTIQVESAGAGKGSRFRFTLPLLHGVKVVAPAVAPALERPARPALVRSNDPIAQRLRELI